MPELRFDPLGRRHVIVAPERARRGAPVLGPESPDPAPCDFCGGREDRTPPESFAIRDPDTSPDTPGWRVRVVPNLYPATPVHDVVVHTPDHLERFEDQDRPQRLDVMRAYRTRLREEAAAASVIVWNRGRAAGASRTHAHGQIFGLEQIPPTLEREAAAFAGDPCVLCGLAGDPDLVVETLGDHRVVAHPVPVVADELLIVPPCTPRLEELDDAGLEAAAEAFAASILLTLGALGEGVPFNLVVHSAPPGMGPFHWHAHVMPRTAVWGGLEMGAEVPVVAADPHQTARSMRSRRP